MQQSLMKRYLILATILMTFAYAKTLKEFYEDGTIKSAITYKNGKKNGVEHAYYPDGATLRYAKNYEHGRLHGLQQTYSKDAILIQEESYKKGQLDGRSRYYNDGLLYKEIEYNHGKLDGTYREFYPTGMTKLEIRWDRGRAVEGYIYDEIGRRSAMSTKELYRLKPDTFIVSLTPASK